jgi:hypothetical protein
MLRVTRHGFLQDVRALSSQERPCAMAHLRTVMSTRNSAEAALRCRRLPPICGRPLILFRSQSGTLGGFRFS